MDIPHVVCTVCNGSLRTYPKKNTSNLFPQWIFGEHNDPEKDHSLLLMSVYRPIQFGDTNDSKYGNQCGRDLLSFFQSKAAVFIADWELDGEDSTFLEYELETLKNYRRNGLYRSECVAAVYPTALISLHPRFHLNSKIGKEKIEPHLILPNTDGLNNTVLR